MPTIIDSMLVKLGLDSSGFESGKNKVKNSLKETQQEAKNTQKSFGEVAGAATKFLAVIGGAAAIKHFVMDMIEANSALDRLSRNLQISVQEISAWSNATEIAGGSADGLQGTMRRLSAEQTKLMLTGESGLIPYFYALGISMSDAYGKARPVNDLLLDIGQALLERAPDRATAFNMGQAMGIDEGTLNLILRGRKEAELMLSRQREFGSVSKQQAEEASRLQKAMREGKQEFFAFGRELLSSATPALEKFFSLFSGFVVWIRANKGFVQAFLTILAAGLVAIGAALTPINLTAVAVASLAAAIALLYDDYQTWKKGGDSLIDWSLWEPGINAAIKGITWIKNLLGDMIYRTIALGDAFRAMVGDIIYRAIAAGNAIASLMKGDLKGAKFAIKEFLSGNEKSQKEFFSATREVARGNGKPYDSPAEKTDAMAFFQGRGWSKEQAAGIVANLKRESALNPAAVGDSGKAYGIAQWHPDRQKKFQKVFGKPIQGSSLEEQLAFVQYELTRGAEVAAGNRLKQTKTAGEAGSVISRFYERPLAQEKESLFRGQMAASMFASGAGSPRPGGQATTTVEGNKSVETHIGEVKVYTQATDAKGIANDMGNALDYLFTSQANYGLT